MSSPKKKSGRDGLISGRFSGSVHESVQDFTRSVQFDYRLYAHDIRGSIAHAAMLRKIGVLTTGEYKSIVAGLGRIADDIANGKFRWKNSLEDVHMNIEAALTEKVPAGAKLHTGRSRNDQVALDMRLWLKDQIQSDFEALSLLLSSLVSLSKKNIDVVIPGYTHLQRAQPVYLAHHLLAYGEMFARDIGRLSDALKRINISPLGSGAIAGSTIKLDREYVADQLGFESVTQNSMDAVSDRDFLIEYNAACALIAVHLSRLGEDLILWSSAEFGFIRIGDAFTTGSSLMPQKKNPDVAELVRGKSARVIGNLMALLTLVKGLPMTYNRDLQEDKERLFDTADTVNSSLKVMALMLRDIEVNRERCTEASSDPLLLATDVADALVNKGIPFRHAHHIVGKAVALAESRKVQITSLTLEDWKQIEPKIDKSVLEVFDVHGALSRRRMTGAPSLEQIQKRLDYWSKLVS